MICRRVVPLWGREFLIDTHGEDVHSWVVEVRRFRPGFCEPLGLDVVC